MKAVLEKVPVVPQQSIHAFAYAAPTFATPWHFHPECELTLIEEGSGIRYVGDHIGDFQRGDFVLLGANLPHCWKNVTGGPAHSLVLQWPERLTAGLPEFRAIRALLRRARRGLRFPPAAGAALHDRVAAIVAADPLTAYLELLPLLAELARRGDAEPLAQQTYSYDGAPLTGRRLRDIQQFVGEHYDRKITLAEMAAHVNMSQQSFSRFFSKAMGRPFFRFLNEYRINVAAKMLLESEATVAEIAFGCGYDTLPFFYRQFRRFKRVTPTRFRSDHGL